MTKDMVASPKCLLYVATLDLIEKDWYTPIK